MSILTAARLRDSRRSITIEETEPGHWNVSQAGAYCDHLNWDEMLGLVVRLTHTPGLPPYPMLTADEHAECKRQSDARIAAFAAKD